MGEDLKAVQRFGPDAWGGGYPAGDMEPDADGEWVRHEDYDALVARLEKAEEALRELREEAEFWPPDDITFYRWMKESGETKRIKVAAYLSSRFDGDKLRQRLDAALSQTKEPTDD